MDARKMIAKCVISTASVVAAVPTVAAEFEWVQNGSSGFEDYSSSDYTYCDAKKVGSVFRDNAFYGMSKINNWLGSEYEDDIDRVISEVGEEVPCTFDEIGVSHDDAIKLAAFWGRSVPDAKAEAARLSSIDGGRSFRDSMSSVIGFTHSELIEPENSATSEQASVRGEISSLFDQLKAESCVSESDDDRSFLSRCRVDSGQDFLISGGEHYTNYAIGTELFPTGPFILDRSQNFSYLWTNFRYYYNLIDHEEELWTFEWRVEEVDGDLRPFAVILRAAPGSEYVLGEMLQILKFGPDHSCPIATVSFYGPESYTKAREIADAALGTNPCARVNLENLVHWRWEHREY